MSSATGGIEREALLADLNEPQQRAVAHTDGPLLVLAGAGSGKTRVITRRAAHLVATGVSPWEVLAITFTNKAADEMRERIGRLGAGAWREPTPGQGRGGMTVCTFHSLGARLLRTYHDRAELAANFTIFDETDRRAVVKEALNRCDLNVSNWSPRRVAAGISEAKSILQSPEEMEDRADYWADRTVARIYKVYEQILAEEQGLDFDDLLLRPTLLLQNDEELRERLEQRFRYLLIDEYQDTNEAQYRLAHLLTLGHRNICATGDPDQSIYGWRGADIGNILRFEEDYPGAEVVRLEQNYRSTQRILSAASALISVNLNRKDKALWTENAVGRRVHVVECPDAEAEAGYIASQIARRRTDDGRLNDVAILYRINALSLSLEMALQRAGIAYQVARGQAFYGRKEIKDLLAYVRVLINPADTTSLRRIINTPARGIGKTTVGRLEALAQSTGRRLFQVIEDPSVREGLGRSAAKVARFAELMASLGPLTEGPAADALDRVAAETGLRASLLGEGTIDVDPLENVETLIGEARKYDAANPDGSLLGWLEQTSLLGDADSIDPEAGAVTLMTLHAAKGLEFPAIFIVGLEDGLLPLRRDDDDCPDIEEERRLCFVGMTRAKEELTLTHTRFRLRRGQTLRNVRSPFVTELPGEELECEILGEETDGRVERRSASGLPEDLDLWQAGTLVRHPRYGLGKVMDLMRRAGRHGVSVVFQEDGDRRSFVLEHTELIRVDFHEVGED
ncbi:MAG: UvrD-helicase domain-containing protein [bacterium]|nr:UvrD-helicase domain-containing protein [bacterium]